jgi:hypothetical protein
VITERDRAESAETQFAEYLTALFSKRAPDIIVAFGHQPQHLFNGTEPTYFLQRQPHQNEPCQPELRL